MDLPVNYNETPSKQRKVVREEYIKIQKGLCYHCELPLNESPAPTKPIDASLFPKGFFIHPVHLHHSHDTGMTLGAVHSKCNAELWQWYGE